MEKHFDSLVAPREAKRLSGVYLETLRGLDPQAIEDMKKVPLPDSQEQVRDLLELSDNKRVTVSAVMLDGERLGTFLWAVLTLHGKRTLWIVAISAVTPAYFPHLFPALGDKIRELARKHGCEWVRADTSRPPVFKQLLDLGFLPGTVELYKKLDDESSKTIRI